MMNSKKQSTTTFIVLLFLSIATSISASEILTDRNFDDLSVGTAPDNGRPNGAWHIANNGFGESGENNYSIVETSSFVPGAIGNSLSIRRPQVPRTPTGVTNEFNEVIHQNEGEIVRASFDLFIPETETTGQPGVNLFVGGDHGGRAFARRTDRGPQLEWDRNGAIRSWVCDQRDNCSSYVDDILVEETPLNAWQHVQVDIDLTNDTYDFFWGTEGTTMELVAPYIGFRSESQDFLDRFAVFFYANAGLVYREGDAYLDNISIEVLEKRPGDANLDGKVDATDLNALALNWRSEGAAWSQGDLTGDRNVDASDLNALALNWQSGVASAAAAPAAVPEPSSITLLLLGACSLVRRVGRKLG